MTTPTPEQIEAALDNVADCLGHYGSRETLRTAIASLQAEVDDLRSLLGETRESLGYWIKHAAAQGAENTRLKSEVERKDEALRDARSRLYNAAIVTGSDPEFALCAVAKQDAAIAPLPEPPAKVCETCRGTGQWEYRIAGSKEQYTKSKCQDCNGTGVNHE